MLAQLKLDEAAKLEFSVAISGTSDSPECRFIIELGLFSLMLKCRQVDDTIEVNIPPLKSITTSGDKEVRLEVIIDGKIFTPLKDVINFEPCIEIESKAKPVVKAEDMVRVTVKKPEMEEKGGYLVIKKKND